MKNLIWISCCLLVACGSGNESGSGVPHPPARSICEAMANGVSTHLIPGTYDVEVDVVHGSGTANNGYVYSTVCHGKQDLTLSDGSQPGTIKITTGLTPVIFFRLTPAAGIDFKSFAVSTQLTEAAALIDGTGSKPKPVVEWSTCVGRQITGFESTPYHFIFFPLCPAGTSEKDYTYAVILENTQSHQPFQLDPQIIHHP